MIWLLAYAILGVLTSLIVPFLLTKRHESQIKKLNLGDGSRVALCVIAGLVWPLLIVEYAIRGIVLVFRAMTRVTWLGALNFLVMQWFGLRLARCYVERQVFVRCSHLTVVGDGYSMGYTTETERVFVGYRLLRWIVPLTGWWSEFRWIRWNGVR